MHNGWGVHEVFMISLFWNSDGWLACAGSYYSRTQEHGGMFIYFGSPLCPLSGNCESSRRLFAKNRDEGRAATFVPQVITSLSCSETERGQSSELRQLPEEIIPRAVSSMIEYALWS
jgi:hypothetical protein